MRKGSRKNIHNLRDGNRKNSLRRQLKIKVEKQENNLERDCVTKVKEGKNCQQLNNIEVSIRMRIERPQDLAFSISFYVNESSFSRAENIGGKFEE